MNGYGQGNDARIGDGNGKVTESHCPDVTVTLAETGLVTVAVPRVRMPAAPGLYKKKNGYLPDLGYNRG